MFTDSLAKRVTHYVREVFIEYLTVAFIKVFVSLTALQKLNVFYPAVVQPQTN